MKFTVSTTALLKHLHIMQDVIAGKHTLPILDHFLFQITGTELTIEASDLDTTVLATTTVEAKKADGMVAIPARMLVKVLRILPAQHITVVVGKDFRATISCEQGTYQLAGQDPMNFPKTPVVEKPARFNIQASALNRGITKTLWAAGNDDLRPVMSGVFFELSKEGLHFVATDAHRLIDHSTKAVHHKDPHSFIVRRKSAKVLRSFMQGTSGKVAVTFNKERAAFAFEGTTVICRLVDGKYPNYRAVFPAEAPNRITVDRMPLYNCIRRMNVFTNRITHQIRLSMAKGTVTVSAEDLDNAHKATEALACEYEGATMDIGFNAHFIMDVLKNLNCQQVVLQMDKPNRAVTITTGSEDGEETTLSLVMPVMLNN